MGDCGIRKTSGNTSGKENKTGKHQTMEKGADVRTPVVEGFGEGGEGHEVQRPPDGDLAEVVGVAGVVPHPGLDPQPCAAEGGWNGWGCYNLSLFVLL